MFQNIKLNEIQIFAKSMTKGFVTDEGEIIKPISTEEALEEIELIDNMLTVMKSKSLLNKKRGLKRTLNGLISQHLDKNSVQVGGSNNHLNI